MNFKTNLKTTASIIALSVSLVGNNVFAMQASDVDGKGKSQLNGAYLQAGGINSGNEQSFIASLCKRIPGRDTVYLEDGIDMGLASCLYANNLQYDSTEHRLLSCDGGGIRGLPEILLLAVFEKIMNLEENDSIRMAILEKNFGTAVLDLKKDQDQLALKKEILEKYAMDHKKYSVICDDLQRRISVAQKNKGRIPVYIRDFFDAGAGTSTGSILVAGLFTNQAKANGENLTTIDIAKLYFRYGYKIFDECKRIGENRLFDNNKVTSQYENNGLKSMLTLYFGNQSIKEGVYKPIYIAAFNETEGEGILFSTYPRESQPLADKISLFDATLCSSSAPTYFDAHFVTINGKLYQFCDGGIFHNNPAHFAYSADLDIIDAMGKKVPYGIYSLGTGSVVRTAKDIRAYDAGQSRTASYIPPYMMNGSIEGDIELCKEAVKSKRQPLECFVRLNPKLQSGMDLLDITTSEYIMYLTQKAMLVTEGNVFRGMCEKLGLQMPNMENLKTIQKSILSEMYHLESDSWDALDDLEKEYVLRKIDESDFNFYENVKKQLGDEKTAVFIQNIVAYYKANYESKPIYKRIGILTHYVFQSLIWGEDDPQKKLDLGQQFHNKTNDRDQLNPITIEQLNSLEGKLDVGLGVLSATYKLTNEVSKDIAMNFYQKFVELLPDELNRHNSNYVGFFAAIYVKDTLRDVQEGGELNKQKLLNLYHALYYSDVYKELTKKNWGFSSRIQVLAEQLKAYIDKNFPHI